MKEGQVIDAAETASKGDFLETPVIVCRGIKEGPNAVTGSPFRSKQQDVKDIDSLEQVSYSSLPNFF